MTQISTVSIKRLVQTEVDGQCVTFELIPPVHKVNVREDNTRVSCSCGWAAASKEPFDDIELQTMVETHLK